MAKSKSQTPLMRQYSKIKEQHPDTILLFRVGDFYETFDEDAVLASRELGITLTKRNNGGDQTPLAGFPFHALDTYLPKLIRRGHKVAVCEQSESPEEAKAQKKKIVQREVTEIVTPGVTLSDKLLDHKKNNYLLSLHSAGTTAGLSFCDVSTGEFVLTQCSIGMAESLVAAIQPSEVLLNKRLKSNPPIQVDNYAVSWLEDWNFEQGFGYKLLTDHFKTHSLKGFGVDEQVLGIVAAGALLQYVKDTQRSSLGQIRRIAPFDNTDYMILDEATKRNLELTSTMKDGGSDGSLFNVLDDTSTAMGARCLRNWIMRPLKKLKPITARLNAVEAFYLNDDLRMQLKEELSEIGDLERLVSRINANRSGPRDLKQLEYSFLRLPRLKMVMQEVQEPLVQELLSQVKLLPEVHERIHRAIKEEPPAQMRDGGYIRDGYSSDLDELRDIARNGKDYITRIKNDLAQQTGISSLKLGYNKVFGYYIEVTNTHKAKVPETFIRKQTLVNSERYITPELKEIEEKVLSAEDKMVALETELFQELRLYIAEYTDQIQQTAAAIAQLDALQSLGQIAKLYGYCKPVVADSGDLDIRQGRHPVVERSLPLGEPFIPNNLHLNLEERQIAIITGPNMAGKSIILRQTGLIVLLAQIGSFVPAESASIGIVDKIFTRVGASDNLAAGESTFLVEMNEAANILNNASPRSLILLDEVGRGTSTFDGLSIAWSLAEYLHNQPAVAAKTLFATHYHELNELASLYPRITNYNVQVTEHGGKVIFLRKLIEGGADHSYGIQVASMAGLPDLVISRAKEILSNLENHSLDIMNENGTLVEGAAKKQKARSVLANTGPQENIPQLSLFQASTDPITERILEKLKASDPNRMSPIEALLLLTELKALQKH